MSPQYVSRNGKLMRCGYTTGSCAAGAAKAAAEMLFTRCPVETTDIDTPAGIRLHLEILESRIAPNYAECAVRKDGGDDPDATHGLLIFARVSLHGEGIRIVGGEGVGYVTKPGLDQCVGSPAINSTPRRMIAHELTEVFSRFSYSGGAEVRISVPGGQEVAQRTFNPKMGIEGGISIVGTTGIVDPMSSRALIETMRLEMSQLAAEGERGLLLVPGNYGKTFAAQSLALSTQRAVMCSNYIGAAFDAAVETGFEKLLLVGHIGKLVKMGIGITDTHSSAGDGRMETLLACTLQAGGELELLRAVSQCVTTDGVLALLRSAGLLEKVMSLLGQRISECMGRKLPEQVQWGFVCFTNAPPGPAVLIQSENAEEIMKCWRVTE